jgi:hypothetical protein
MGVILKCGGATTYISLLNWTNFKIYVLFLTFQIIGKMYPNLFIFIDEQLEIYERINNFKSMTDLASSENVHKNQMVLFPSIFIDYVNANKNNIHNMELTGIHDLFNNTFVYDFNHCKNIFIALNILNTHQTYADRTLHKDYTKISSMFECGWTTKQDVCIL